MGSYKRSIYDAGAANTIQIRKLAARLVEAGWKREDSNV